MNRKYVFQVVQLFIIYAKYAENRLLKIKNKIIFLLCKLGKREG